MFGSVEPPPVAPPLVPRLKAASATAAVRQNVVCRGVAQQR